MRLTWIAVTAAAMLGEAVSGCTCTPRPKTTPASAARVSPKAPPSAENTPQKEEPLLPKEQAARKAAAMAARLLKLDAPLTYKDPGSGILIYVETDRRHFAGIDPSGKVIWCRDLLKEEPARINNSYEIEPLIYSIHAPMDWTLKQMASKSKPGPFAGIGFLNKSFGVIDVRTGEFTWMGND
jgi:hypothetical protein